FVEGSITAAFGYESIGIPQLGHSIRKRLREIHGIFDRDPHSEGVGTGLLEAFDDMHLVTVLQARAVEPGIPAHANRIHNEDLALPMCHGRSLPLRISHRGRMLSI